MLYTPSGEPLPLKAHCKEVITLASDIIDYLSHSHFTLPARHHELYHLRTANLEKALLQARRAPSRLSTARTFHLAAQQYRDNVLGIPCHLEADSIQFNGTGTLNKFLHDRPHWTSMCKKFVCAVEGLEHAILHHSGQVNLAHTPDDEDLEMLK